METIIKLAIEGGYAIQQPYYARPVLFTSLKHTNEYYTVFELDDTTVIEDGNGEEKTIPLTTSHQTSKIFLDPLFWQALGKASGWNSGVGYDGEIKKWYENQVISTQFISQEPCVYEALRFHEINLTEGWDKAVAYLLSITSK